MEQTAEEAKEKFVNLWPVEAHTECSGISEVDKEPAPEESVLQLELRVPPLLTDSVAAPGKGDGKSILYERYESELQMPDIMRLMKTALSEPYSIYTYRYFIHNWPKLCVLAKSSGRCVGAIVCKLEMHNYSRRGYIAMLAVDSDHRKRKIGKCRDGVCVWDPFPKNGLIQSDTGPIWLGTVS